MDYAQLQDAIAALSAKVDDLTVAVEGAAAKQALLDEATAERDAAQSSQMQADADARNALAVVLSTASQLGLELPA